METINTIFRIITIIGSLILFSYLWNLFLGWFSKTNNTNIYYRGKIISRPESHQENISEFKETKEKIITNAKMLIKRITDASDKKISVTDKIKALKELEELRNSDIITEEEFQHLKSKIL